VDGLLNLFEPEYCQRFGRGHADEILRWRHQIRVGSDRNALQKGTTYAVNSIYSNPCSPDMYRHDPSSARSLSPHGLFPRSYNQFKEITLL